MAKSTAGKTSGGEGLVEPEGTGRPEHPDVSGDGTLQPGGACTDEGAEVPLRLVRVVKTRRWQQVVNSLTGEAELWEETQEYVPRKDSDDDIGTTWNDATTG